MPIPGGSGSSLSAEVSEEIPYITRETVQDALPSINAARMDARIDQAILTASRDAEGWLHRTFYPWTGTRHFDVPEEGTLWLYEHELTMAPTTIVSGDQTLDVNDFFLRPTLGPPYRWIEISWGGDGYWSSLATPQNAIAITGTYGYPTRVRSAADIVGSIDSTTTTVTLSTSYRLGHGSLLRVGGERVLVTRLDLAATGATLAGDLAASKGVITVPVSNGTMVDPGERILIGGESMAVDAVAGNELIVERAARGSVLAAHTAGAVVYAPRQATVSRGILGTSAAAHADATEVHELNAPSLVQELVLALAINNIQQGLNAYTRPRGASDNKSEISGRGVQEILEDAYTRYGRKARSRAVGS